MTTKQDEEQRFTNLHLLYYAGLYEKIFNAVPRQTLAFYNIDYVEEKNKMKTLVGLEKLVKQLNV